MNSFLSKFTAAITVGLGGAMATGAINPKAAGWIAIGAAMLQAFQAPVQQSAADTKVAKDAIAATKTTV